MVKTTVKEVILNISFYLIASATLTFITHKFNLRPLNYCITRNIDLVKETGSLQEKSNSNINLLKYTFIVFNTYNADVSLV